MTEYLAKESPRDDDELFQWYREAGTRAVEWGRQQQLFDIPADYATFEQFSRDYERTHFRPNPGSQRVAAATTRMFAGWAGPLRGLVPPVIAALMDEPLRRALELPEPSPALRRTVAALLRLRGHLGQTFSSRSRPNLRTAGRHRSYPCGYAIETLGPPEPPAA